MVGSGEGSLAHLALEWAVARVFAVVTGQLVGAGKLPAATFPSAVIGLLT